MTESQNANAIITVETMVNAPIEKVWRFWNEPAHIEEWAHASEDWVCPHAENDLRIGGRFLTRMESADGKQGFDFTGTYTEVEENSRIEYAMDDGRKVKVYFENYPEGVKVSETFDPENVNPLEMQRAGWQAILDNFKKCVEEGE